MEGFLRFIGGYVRLRIQGGEEERFLNLCRVRGIEIRKLRREEDGSLTFEIPVSSFFALKPIRAKTGVHVHILKKTGAPFALMRGRRRKAFFLGIAACAALLFLLSGRIWNIHIEGNVRNTTQSLLEYLEEEGVFHGMKKSEADCNGIAAGIREAYPDITWVSARIEGTRLILNVKEGIFGESENTEEEGPCSIAAEESGTVVKMITRSGSPLVKVGDACKKGDVLVLGRLELKNDSQEVFRYEYVHADADIYIKRSIPYYAEFPLEYIKETPTGKEQSGGFFRVGRWYLEWGIGRGNREEIEDQEKTGNQEGTGSWEETESRATNGNEDESEDTETNETVTTVHPIRLTENFYLPISYGTIHTQPLEETTSTRTKQQAKALAFQNLQAYEEKLMEKGVQISANNVKIEVDHKICISKGSLEIIEKTGKEVPVEKAEEPSADTTTEERTTEDG